MWSMVVRSPTACFVKPCSARPGHPRGLWQPDVDDVLDVPSQAVRHERGDPSERRRSADLGERRPPGRPVRPSTSTHQHCAVRQLLPPSGSDLGSSPPRRDAEPTQLLQGDESVLRLCELADLRVTMPIDRQRCGWRGWGGHGRRWLVLKVLFGRVWAHAGDRRRFAPAGQRRRRPLWMTGRAAASLWRTTSPTLASLTLASPTLASGRTVGRATEVPDAREGFPIASGGTVARATEVPDARGQRGRSQGVSGAGRKGSAGPVARGQRGRGPGTR